MRMRAIDADKLKQDVLDWEDCPNGFSDVYDKARIIDAIDEQPTITIDIDSVIAEHERIGYEKGLRDGYAEAVDAEPVKHGYWIGCKGSDGKDYRKCSECLHTQNITGLLNFCPVCGSKMDLDEVNK